MAAVDRVLVIGAGTAGPAAATLLAAAGVEVEVIDVSPELTALGSGITLQGNALRVFRELGVLDEALEHGWPSEGSRMRRPDGIVIGERAELRTGGSDLPASMGMYRPDLARILMDRAIGAGVRTRFATTVTTLEQDADGVDVTFSDGTAGRYDLVIAADGVRSPTRHLLGIPLETRSMGLGIWRVFAPRPAEITTSEATLGGPLYVAGMTPVSATHLYAFLVEDLQDRADLDPHERVEAVRELIAGYGGPWPEVRESITDASQIHYTRFEEHLLEGPWHRGRVVLIGDAVHTCPPLLAQGAALGLEDASVLAELVLAADRIDDELLDAFVARRFDRVKTLVDTSIRLTLMQVNHEPGDVLEIMARSAELTSRPA